MNLDSLVESICLTLVATQSISVGVAILCGFAIALIARGRANIPKSLKQSYTKLIWIHQLLLVLFVALLLRGFIIEPLIEEVPVTLRTAGFALGLVCGLSHAFFVAVYCVRALRIHHERVARVVRI